MSSTAATVPADLGRRDVVAIVGVSLTLLCDAAAGSFGGDVSSIHGLGSDPQQPFLIPHDIISTPESGAPDGPLVHTIFVTENPATGLRRRRPHRTGHARRQRDGRRSHHRSVDRLGQRWRRDRVRRPRRRDRERVRRRFRRRAARMAVGHHRRDHARGGGRCGEDRALLEEGRRFPGAREPATRPTFCSATLVTTVCRWPTGSRRSTSTGPRMTLTVGGVDHPDLKEPGGAAPEEPPGYSPETDGPDPLGMDTDVSPS